MPPQDKTPTYVKLFHDSFYDIESGRLTLKAFGFLQYLRCKANPHNGYVQSVNLLILSQLTHLGRDEVRDLCRRLKKLGKIYYRDRQGKAIDKIYIVNYPLSDKSYLTIERIKAKLPEVGSAIPKSTDSLSPLESTRCEKPSEQPPEVPKKEEGEEKDIKKGEVLPVVEQYMPRGNSLFRSVTVPQWTILEQLSAPDFVDSKVQELIKRYANKKKQLSFDFLQRIIKADFPSNWEVAKWIR